MESIAAGDSVQHWKTEPSVSIIDNVGYDIICLGRSYLHYIVTAVNNFFLFTVLERASFLPAHLYRLVKKRVVIK